MRHVERRLGLLATRGQYPQGQAMLETLLGVGIMSLLLIMVMVLARQTDLRAATTFAGQALAFECSARPVDCDGPSGVSDDLADEVRSRYFGAVDTPIRSLDRLRTQEHGVLSRPFWRKLDGQALISDPSQIALTSRHASFDAGINVASNRLLPSLAHPVSRLALQQAGPNQFGLDPTQGLRVGDVKVAGHFQLPAAEPGRQFALSPFEMNSRSAHLGDSWTGLPEGSDLQPINERVRAGSQLDRGRESLLSIAYAPVLSLLQVFSVFGLEPTGGQFKRLPIDAAVLPPDVLVFP